MTEEPILLRLIETVRASRERTAAYFPLPDAGSCVDYAITESGEYLKALTQAYIDEAIISATEYLDAYLRAHRAGDKRRQDKDHSMVREWGQAGYMLASALIQSELFATSAEYELLSAGDEIDVYDVLAQMCSAVKFGGVDMLLNAFDMWACFAMRTLHVEPMLLIVKTCQYFENKFMPQAEVGSV